jgi:hypothetical protein
MEMRDRVLTIVRSKGPVTPTQIARGTESDTIMASAVLSELVSEGQIRITYFKVGSSSLYYAPGQEARLENFMSSLNEKDRRTVNLLKQKKVLKDADQQPLVRVSLRNIRDFATPITVTRGDKKEVFWKWYLLSADETQRLIKDQLGIKEPEKPTEPKKVPEKQAQPKSDREKKEGPYKKEHTPQPKPAPKDVITPFSERVSDYFRKNDIVVQQKEVVRKNDMDFIVQLPSAVGVLTYYCKARDKKKINDGDLAAAYVKGENKKLPILFLTTGDLTKKAKDMLNKEFKNTTVKQI